MRKLIVALVVLGLVAAASVWEIVWLKRTFDTAIEMLEKVDDAVSADVENVNNAPAMRSMNELIDWWEDRRTLVMGLLNHAQVKNIDDRFVMIARQLEVNAGMDAAITVRTTMRLMEDLYYDAIPGFVCLRVTAAFSRQPGLRHNRGRYAQNAARRAGRIVMIG